MTRREPRFDERGGEGELCVLESFRGIRPTTNPYIVQLWEALRAEPGVRVSSLDWRTALFGRYDVFHVHWPETLMQANSWQGRVVRRLLTTLFCLRLFIRRIPVVRTWHNLERPSGLGWYDRRLLDAFDRLTRVRIRLNPLSPVPPDAPAVTILHGDYRDWFDAGLVREPVPGRIGYVGLIRRYKGVEELLEAFAETSDPALSLHVAGSPSSEELIRAVRDAEERDPRITSRLEFLDDPAFVEAVTSSELVVLPYRHMHNSGTALAALSLGRPVLVPDNEVNRLLADEVGAAWVQLFTAPLGADDLSAAHRAVAGRPASSPPDLSRRTWTRAGADHAEAFRLALRGPGSEAS